MDQDNIVFVAIEDPTPMRVLGIHWKRERAITPQAALFADAIRQTVQAASADAVHWPHVQQWSDPRGARSRMRPGYAGSSRLRRR
jgi:nicotinamidase-related amidase